MHSTLLRPLPITVIAWHVGFSALLRRDFCVAPPCLVHNEFILSALELFLDHLVILLLGGTHNQAWQLHIRYKYL